MILCVYVVTARPEFQPAVSLADISARPSNKILLKHSKQLYMIELLARDEFQLAGWNSSPVEAIPAGLQISTRGCMTGLKIVMQSTGNFIPG
jgi:hypothetical protein